MKREMNVRLTTLIGVLVLGISHTSFAEVAASASAEADHNKAASPAISRPATSEEGDPGVAVYDEALAALVENAGKSITIRQIELDKDSDTKEIKSEDLTKMENWTKIFRKYSVELNSCGTKDPSAVELKGLLESFNKEVKWALFGKPEAAGVAKTPNPKKEASEQKLVMYGSQIKKVIEARISAANRKEDAEIIELVEKTLKVLFDESRLAQWPNHARFQNNEDAKALKEKVAASLKAFEELSEGEHCSFVVAEGGSPRGSSGGGAGGQITKGPHAPTGDDDAGGEQGAGGGEDVITESGQAIDPNLLAQLGQNNFDDVLQAARDDFDRRLQDLLNQQNQALLAQNQNDDQVLAEALKALGQGNNEAPVVTPPAAPAPISPPQISAGSGGGGQQQPFPQDYPQDQAPMMPMYPGMFGQPQQQPYQPNPLFLAESKFNDDEPARKPTITTTITPQMSAMQAQQSLLNMMRMQQGQQGMGAYNPLMNGQQQVGTVGARLSAGGLSSLRGTGASALSRGQTATSLSGKNGASQLAVAPGARAQISSSLKARLGR